MMAVNSGTSPPVVFISQLGTAGASWKPVIDLLTTGATTVTYDRPGTGDAPPRPAPNPPLPYSVFADELAALLDEQGIAEPAVLVGHSVGSLIARVFVERHLDRVTGLVHVDASIPRLSLWPVAPPRQTSDGDGPDATQFDTVAGEIEVIEAITTSWPTAVVARTPGRWSEGYEDADPLWTAYQRQLALQSNSALVVARDAGHQIPTEASALVAHIVDATVWAVRTGERWMPDPLTLASVGGALDPRCQRIRAAGARDGCGDTKTPSRSSDWRASR